MKVIEHLSAAQLDQLCELYQREWWCRGRSLEETAQGVAGSQLCIGLVDDDGQLQGFARVLTDYIFKAMIFDVIVAAEHRGNGLGQQLLTMIRQHPRLQRVRHFELYCLPELAEFYRQSGFSEQLGGIGLMRLTTR